MSDRSQDTTQDESLYQLGWRQGALFSAPSLRHSWNDVPSADNESLSLEYAASSPNAQYVVISQDCDIEHTDLDNEPYIEAMLCAVAKEGADLANWERNSPRFFPLDKELRLIVLATSRVQIAKRALTGLTPRAWPFSQQLLRNFVYWLGRRYTRPAFPDDFNKIFADPVTSILQNFSKTQRAVFSDAVSEVRVLLTRSETPPYDPQVPYDPRLLIITKTDSLTKNETDVIELFLAQIQKKIRHPNLKLNPNAIIRDPKRISVELYFDCTQLYLDYYTYKGDIEEGAPPASRA